MSMWTESTGIISERDMFAAAALTAIIGIRGNDQSDQAGICKEAFIWADMMIRIKQQQAGPDKGNKL